MATEMLPDGHEAAAIVGDLDQPFTLVEYSRLRNLGNYENEKIGVQAVIMPGETPDGALARCRAFVAAQFGERDEIDALRRRREHAQRQANEAERHARKLTSVWREMAAILAEHMVTPESRPDLRWDWPPPVGELDEAVDPASADDEEEYF